MQSDFDKLLKDKLRGYEADFNPTDWQKMETLLPEKPKKPYRLLALLLLFLGIGGLLVGTGEFKKGNNAAVIAQENSSANSNENGDTEFKNENAVNSIEEKKSALNSEIETSDTNEQNQVAGSSGKTKNEFVKQSDDVRAPSSASVRRGEVVIKKKSSSDEKNNKVSNDSQKTSSRKKTGISNSYEANYRQSYYSSAENLKENQVKNENNIETISALASIESDFISLTEEEKIFVERTALSDDALPKHKLKKQIVTFALGGGAGINFSFTDATRWTKPGYTVDVAQEIMFINRIGIAFTQGYSVRNYDGGQYPCPSGTIDCPYSYNSAVRSIDFGVDLKANLIHKAKWNWYVKAGITNTVKLKEEFTYSYPQTDTIIPPTLPPQTNFNGGSFNEAMQDNSSGINNSTYPPDLTISGVKRNHIALHSATGFDVALNSKLQLQVETGYSLTQATVGVDDRRLHSIGVNGRLFYRFGR